MAALKPCVLSLTEGKFYLTDGNYLLASRLPRGFLERLFDYTRPLFLLRVIQQRTTMKRGQRRTSGASWTLWRVRRASALADSTPERMFLIVRAPRKLPPKMKKTSNRNHRLHRNPRIQNHRMTWRLMEMERWATLSLSSAVSMSSSHFLISLPLFNVLFALPCISLYKIILNFCICN